MISMSMSITGNDNNDDTERVTWSNTSMRTAMMLASMPTATTIKEDYYDGEDDDTKMITNVQNLARGWS